MSRQLGSKSECLLSLLVGDDPLTTFRVAKDRVDDRTLDQIGQVSHLSSVNELRIKIELESLVTTNSANASLLHRSSPKEESSKPRPVTTALPDSKGDLGTSIHK